MRPALIRVTVAMAWLAVSLAGSAGDALAAPEPPGPTVRTTLRTPYDLYEVGPWGDERLGALQASPGGWKVLHQEHVDGRTWVLLALPDGSPADAPWGERPRYLGRVRDRERVILTAPATPSQPRLRTGRSVTVTPSGGTVAVTTEGGGVLARRSHGGFRELSREIPPPRVRREGPPPALARSMDRVRRGGVGLRTAEEVRAIVDGVTADSLENYVRTLSETPSGAPTTRWWEDPATTGIHTDYIVSKFDGALSPVGGSVFMHGFDLENDAGQTVRVHNIVGKLPSAVPGAGAILITAHMDATAARSDPVALCDAGLKSPSSGCDCLASDTTIRNDPNCEWDPALEPAPGADDNATGIAALVEAARLLAPLSFDFDLYFVAFQAEEVGLVGSAAFADSVAGADQEIWAVLNVDMLGYNESLNRIHIISDESSEWFADWVVESAEQFVAALPVEKFIDPFGRSDHASFWARGIDAVLLLEDRELPYPGYHSFFDVWETIFPIDGRVNAELQLELSVRLVVASMARFALQYAVPDLAIPPGELSVRTMSGGSDFVSGDDVLLSARVHNLGSASFVFADQTVDSISARVTFYDGPPQDGGAEIGAVDRKAYFASGGGVDFEWTWDTDGATAGFHEIHVEVEGLDTGYEQIEVSPDNNTTSASFFLQAAGAESPRILSQYVYPNPVRGSRADLTFYYEMTRDGGVELTIYDLEGVLVGQFRTGEQFFFEGNEAGPNRVDAQDIRWEGQELDPGVYLYSLRITQGGEVTDRALGKFAVLR